MTPRQSSNPPPPGSFWDRWSVRLVTALLIVTAVLVIANVGDPAPVSWHAKTWELLHDMAATSVGRR